MKSSRKKIAAGTDPIKLYPASTCAEISTNQSSHVTQLRLSDRSKLQRRADNNGIYVHRIGSWTQKKHFEMKTKNLKLKQKMEASEAGKRRF